MNFLERSAVKRAQKQLAGALEPGETILQFDVGTTPNGARVHCIATDLALYLVPRGGAAMRIPYRTIRQTGGGPTWLKLLTTNGSDYTIDFGRTARGLAEVVVDHYRQEAKRRRRLHVSWGNGGATFVVGPDGPREKVLSWTYDEGADEDVTTSMLAEQALGELEIRLGGSPSLQYEDPRPSWMPAFVWDPPL